jgi:glycerol-3-phosphate dehydrogenase
LHHPLSSLNRSKLLQKLQLEEYDLLVIGGGITGAGIALDAASRGIKIALIEKNDFAFGTSSRSTKLIHGGLRYLKQFELKLVAEVGHERAVLHKNAPHLVIPEKMLLPLVKGGTYGPFFTSLGLYLYDFLAGVHKSERRKMLNKLETAQEEPLLANTENLIGGGLYWEYRTDDARLTLEVVKTATAYQADCINYCKADSFIYTSGKITGVNCTDVISGNSLIIKAKKIINATGPWVDELRKNDNSLMGKRLHLTKGVHLVFPKEKFPVKHSVYFDINDGRMMFAIPRGKTTYIGTTDTNFDGNKNSPDVSDKDIDYLVSAVNAMFKSVNLNKNDMISCWSGLRPLIHEDGKSPSELSRKDEIFVSERGLISIAGGKLTGYRKMAEKAVNMVALQLKKESGISFGKCKTKNIILSGGEFSSTENIDAYKNALREKLITCGIDSYYSDYLVSNYGVQSDIILNYLESFKSHSPLINLIRAELKFCMEREAVQTIEDFLLRRTSRLLFDVNSVDESLDYIVKDMAAALNWNEERITREKNSVKRK